MVVDSLDSGGATIRTMVPNSARALAVMIIAALIPLLSACAFGSDETQLSSAPTVTGSPASELSGDVTVFAAASLTESFDELAKRFTQRNPAVTVKTVYDGSTTLATQLIEGARADVFASADEQTMNRVAEAGALSATAQPFASNTLQLAVQPGNPLGITALSDLGSARLTVVLCAPEVPCGAASAALLTAAGVVVVPASEEQNVKAVVTKVELGEADAGIVYTTDVLATNGRVEGILIDGALAKPNHYVIGLPAAGANQTAAHEFLIFVRSAEGQEVLARYGFGPQ